MCSNHDNLNDDLSDIFGSDISNPANIQAGVALAASQIQTYTEKCDANGCRNGTFYSWGGRPLGPCRRCNGSGQRSFKTSPEQRDNARQYAAKRADRKAAEVKESAESWIAANTADWLWIDRNRGSFDFANSMAEALFKFGTLTEKQAAAVTRLREKAQIRQQERQQQANNAPTIDVSKIEDAFATARGKGIKRPKLILGDYKFSLAPSTGANAGALYVVSTNGDYLGKIKDSKFLRVRECTADDEKMIIEVASDPHSAAIAYGRRTGNCCVCNRELTNHASIDAGIGPICAERFGW